MQEEGAAPCTIAFHLQGRKALPISVKIYFLPAPWKPAAFDSI